MENTEKHSWPVSLFISYAREDELLCKKLKDHLALLQLQGFISIWTPGQTSPGDEPKKAIDEHLDKASIILLLVSHNFLASNQCYEKEMPRALERHQAGQTQVIPIILRPYDLDGAPFAHLQSLPINGKPITIWENEDEAFANVTASIHSFVQKLPLHSTNTLQATFPIERDMEEPGRYDRRNQQSVQGSISPNSFSKYEQDNRESLLKRVYNHSDNTLQPLLPQDTWIELRLQERPDALDNPLLSGPETNEKLSPASSIAQIYAQYEQLLILGEPGAGKTTLLYYLARKLVAQAQVNQHNRIPVVLYLSTWTKQKRPPESLNAWVVDELFRLYGVSKKMGRGWVKSNQLLLLLDGLDEVASGAHASCIEAINHYSENSKHLIITCRNKEYQHLSPPLSLRGQSVYILPLTPQEIDNYISLKTKKALELKKTLKENAILAEMARAPLILSLLMQVFQEMTDYSTGSTPEGIVLNLLNIYRKKANLLDSETHWLIFLAKQMKEKRQDPFFLEEMQPTWLPKSYWRAMYLGLIGISFGAIIGMISFPLLGAFVEGLSSLFEWFRPWSIDPEIAVPLMALLLGGPLGGLIGLFIGLLSRVEQITITPSEETNLSWQQKVPEIIPFLLIAIISELICLPIRAILLKAPYFLVFIQLTVRDSITALPGGIIIWIMYELINAFIGSLIYIGNFILFKKGNQYRSIWSYAKRGGMIGLLIGIFDTLFSGFLGGPIYYNITKPFFEEGLFTFRGALIIGLCSGVLSWFAIGLLTIVSHERLEKNTNRVLNQGIRRSLQHSILAIVAFWILFWGIYQFVSGLDYKVFQSIILGFSVSLIPGLLNGGAACIKHAILRYLLRRANCTSPRYTDFLDSMVVRNKPDSQEKHQGIRKKSTNIQKRHREGRILRGIGGGYMFTYTPLLLDYFASLKDPLSASQQKTPSSGNDFPHQLLIQMISSAVVFLIIISLVFGGIYFFQHRLDSVITRCNLYTSNHTNNGKGVGSSYGLGTTLGIALYHMSYNPSLSTEDHIFYTEAALKDALPFANTLIHRGVPLNLGGADGLEELANCPHMVDNNTLISYSSRGKVYHNILAIYNKYTAILQRFSPLYNRAYQLGINIALAIGLASESVNSSKSSINSYLKDAQKFANNLREDRIILNMSELQSILDKIYITAPNDLYSKILSLSNEYQIQLDTAPI